MPPAMPIATEKTIELMAMPIESSNPKASSEKL
jgi:hypothetical protein